MIFVEFFLGVEYSDIENTKDKNGHDNIHRALF